MILLLICIIIILGLSIFIILRCRKKDDQNPKSQILQAPSLNGVTFNILQYNIQFDPEIYLSEGALKRSQKISEVVSKVNNGDIDVITFCEGFVTDARKNLIKKFKQLGWRYSTQVVTSPWISTHPFSNGGVFIISKWPIVKESQFVFTSGTGSDKLAAKGVMYARIKKSTEKGDKIFNVFATHLQAWDTPEGRKVRAQQMTELNKFMNHQKIPMNEPIFYAGDFNADNIKSPDEIQNLANILNARMPRMVGVQKYSSDPSSNTLVGQDGGDDKCHDDYYCHVCFSCKEKKNPQCVPRCNKKGKKPADGSNWWCPCCPQEYLDYILYNKSHQQPITMPTVEVLPLKSPTMIKFSSWHLVQGEPLDNPNMCTYDLSDHYPVIGKFLFPLTS